MVGVVQIFVVFVAIVLIDGVLCTPRIAADENNNLVMDAGEAQNITASARAMLLNGQEVVTHNEMMAMFAQLPFSKQPSHK